MRRLISLALFLFAIPALATTYYVSNTGLDTNNGTSTGTPWQTIAHVNAQTFSAGDSILFQSGGVWREQLTVPSSGSSGSPITIGSYGTGAMPAIYGSNSANSAGNWTEETSGGGYSTIYANTEQDGDSGYRSNSSNAANAGNWTATATGPVTNVIMNVFKTGTIAAGSHSWIEVWNDNGSGLPGTKIGQSDNQLMDSWSTSTPGAAVSFTFSTPVTLTVGQTYYFSLAGDSTLSASNFPDYRRQFNPGFRETSGGVWSGIANVYPALTVQTTIASLVVWYTTVSSVPSDVFRDGVRLTQVTAKANLNATTQWYWDSADSRVYVYSGATNPTTGPHTFEIDQRNYCIDLNGKTYLTIHTIGCAYANQNGITSSVLGSGNILFDTINSSSNFWSGLASMHNSVIGDLHFSNVTVQNSTFAWNGASGINIQPNTANWTIGVQGAGNTLNNNSQLIQVPTAGSPQGYSGGLYAYDGPVGGNMVNVIVQYNNVYANGVLPDGTRININGSYNGGIGLWFDTIRSAAGNYTDSSIMRFNYSHDNTYDNLKFEHTGYAQMYSNVTANANGPNLAGNEIELSDATHTTGGIYDNIIYNNSFLMSLTSNAGLRLVGPSTLDAGSVVGNVFKNNIVLQNGSTTPALLTQWGFENDGTVGSGNVYSFNNLGPNASNYIQWGLGTSYSTVSAWQTASSQTSNLAVDPKFTNPSTENLTLQSSSPMLGAGTNLGGTYNGALLPASTWPSGVQTGTQGSAWNMGAYLTLGGINAFWFAIP